MIKLLIIRIICKCCGRIFNICRRCYRRQVYCSDECRRAGYLERHRAAQQKYQKSIKGKNKRNEAAKRRRKGQKKYTGTLRKLMQTCKELMKLIVSKGKRNEDGQNKKCHICGLEGCVVNIFPRRSYGVGK